MSQNEIYTNIKKSLLSLYNKYTGIDKGNSEYFSLDFFPRPTSQMDDYFLKSVDIPEEIRILKIIPSELYDVIDKFDLKPSELTESEKQLRMKYLDILSKAIESNSEKIYQYYENNVNVDTENVANRQVVLSNMKHANRLVLRIIKLLKDEIYPPQCSEKTGYIVAIIILLIALIISLFMWYKK